MSRVRRSLAVVFAFFLATSAAAAPGDPGCAFDYDQDGFVTQMDVDACDVLLQIFPPIYDPACDANGDGFLSPVDILILIGFIGLDCTVPVPSGSSSTQSVLVFTLLLAGAAALRSRNRRTRVFAPSGSSE